MKTKITATIYPSSATVKFTGENAPRFTSRNVKEARRQLRLIAPVLAAIGANHGCGPIRVKIIDKTRPARRAAR